MEPSLQEIMDQEFSRLSPEQQRYLLALPMERIMVILTSLYDIHQNFERIKNSYQELNKEVK